MPAKLAAEVAGRLHDGLDNKYYVDEVYDAVFVERSGAGRRRSSCGSRRDGRRPASSTARRDHDGASWIAAALRPVRRRRRGERRRRARSQAVSGVFRKAQTGRVQNYALVMGGGTVLPRGGLSVVSMKAIRKAHGLQSHPDPVDHHVHPARSGARDRVPRAEGESRDDQDRRRLRRGRSTSSSRCRSGSAFDRGHATASSSSRSASWIPSLGVNYHFGIDGISLLLILLTTLMGVIAVVSLVHARSQHRAEGVLRPPPAAADGHARRRSARSTSSSSTSSGKSCWCRCTSSSACGAAPRKLYAAIKFFLYTLAGSVLMLLGILALYFYNDGGSLPRDTRASATRRRSRSAVPRDRRS